MRSAFDGFTPDDIFDAFADEVTTDTLIIDIHVFSGDISRPPMTSAILINVDEFLDLKAKT
jgi:hypothetical protein